MSIPDPQRGSTHLARIWHLAQTRQWLAILAWPDYGG